MKQKYVEQLCLGRTVIKTELNLKKKEAQAVTWSWETLKQIIKQ